MMPVTAGKKTANTAQNPTRTDGSMPAARASSTTEGSGGPTDAPTASEISESAIAPMITYCARIAARADMSASPATSTVTTTPVMRWSSTGSRCEPTNPDAPVTSTVRPAGGFCSLSASLVMGPDSPQASGRILPAAG